MRNGSLQSSPQSFTLLLSIVVFGGLTGPSSAFASFPGTKITRCSVLLNPIVSAIDATPFLRRFLNRRLSKGWLESFNYDLYLKMKADYLKASPLTFEQWGFPEASLAYLEALIERASGLKLSLTDSILDDPTHARKLQLLTQNLDFSKPLTPHEIRRILERAFLLTDRLDLRLKDLFHLKSEEVRIVMKEHAMKEVAKRGVLGLYQDLGMSRNEDFWKWTKRMFDDPRVSALLIIPTWTKLGIGVPGLLPTIQWVRFSEAELLQMIQEGIDPVLPSLEPRLRNALAFQRSYEALQSTVAFWAGFLTLAYGAGEILGLSPEELQEKVKAILFGMKEEFLRDLSDGQPGP